MNRIYWDIDKISMLTDHLDASVHSHGMIQFFLCLEDELEIRVGTEKIKCSCILVNKNIRHSFKANNKIHFTCVIEPISDIGMRLNHMLQNKDYYIVDENRANGLKKTAMDMRETFDKATYKNLMTQIYDCFDAAYQKKQFDKRIFDLLKMLERCNCDEHSIEEYAGKLWISASRLSHLFREQVGISLKNFLLLHQLERAFQDLLAGKRITEAALNAGFDSPSHFAFTVKRMMGLSARSTVKDSEFLKVY
ncbi:MAG: helix-turn-helix transcriptional regulator [Lachnospiraceae bacterium]|nr:helix-turn-helix transcriptional regulator [Lachnospiraceae bacterium]